MSARGGRTPSGPWNRLKPVNIDPLEALGLPSKGDNRLLDYRTQERYYAKIVERYMAFCSDAGRGDELLRRLARLDISEDGKSENTIQSPKSSISMRSFSTFAEVPFDPAGKKDVSTIIMSMRKLREGIVASNRVDDFSTQAYIFCIRLSILAKQMEAYHPALLYLLKKMHPRHSLTTVELQEFVGYLVLDLACRQNDLAQAYLIRKTYGLRDTKVDAVLKSLTHDNYCLFWKVKRTVDGHKARLMEFAEEGMKRQALKCLGRSYLSIDLPGLEQYTNSTWSSLTKDHAVGWELEGTKVTIRRPKGH